MNDQMTTDRIEQLIEEAYAKGREEGYGGGWEACEESWEEAA